MKSETIQRKNQENIWLWLIKIMFGFVILFLLGLHFLVNHLIAPEGLLSYNDVVRYYSNPAIPIIEIAFIIFVTTHALLGVRSIILDLNPAPRIVRVLDPLFITIGAGVIIYSIWLILTIASRDIPNGLAYRLLEPLLIQLA
jgi:succinate dehydrogenase hydrophobic anchor subunit